MNILVFNRNTDAYIHVHTLNTMNDTHAYSNPMSTSEDTRLTQDLEIDEHRNAYNKSSKMRPPVSSLKLEP